MLHAFNIGIRCQFHQQTLESIVVGHIKNEMQACSTVMYCWPDSNCVQPASFIVNLFVHMEICDMNCIIWTITSHYCNDSNDDSSFINLDGLSNLFVQYLWHDECDINNTTLYASHT